MSKIGTTGWRFFDAFVAVLSLSLSFAIADAGYLLWRDGFRDIVLAFEASVVGWWSLWFALLPLTVILGLVFVGAGRSTAASIVRAGQSSQKDEHEKSARLLASIAGLLVVVVAVGWLAFGSNRAFAKPHFAAMATGIGAGFALAALRIVQPLSLRLLHNVVLTVARLPVLGWFVRDWRRLATGLVLAAIAVLGWVLFSNWENTFGYAPWNALVRIAFGVVVGSLCYTLWRRIRQQSFARWTCLVGTVLVTLGSAPIAIGMSADDWSLKKAAFEDSLLGSVGRSMIRKAFDVDDDGFVRFLGDGDCEPSNANVFYGATEIPDNEIDEDCDGEDLKADRFKLYRPWNHPIAEGIERKPDIVLVTIDAFAANRVGTKRDGRPLTPYLDSFAKDSVYFSAAFSQGPSTRLSIPAMFTSRWDTMIERVKGSGKPPYSLSAKEKQFQELLALAGYQRLAVISDRNFAPTSWKSATRGFSWVDRSSIGKGGGHNAPEVTEVALRMLDEGREDPVFLWVHYYDPHSPYTQPPGVPEFGTSKEEIYDAEIAFTDQEMAPLLKKLKNRPNTITVLTSDHGTVFHPHPETRKGLYGYRCLYCYVARAPSRACAMVRSAKGAKRCDHAGYRADACQYRRVAVESAVLWSQPYSLVDG